MLSFNSKAIKFNKFLERSFGLFVLCWVAFYGLAIVQDLIFSEIRDTGFYLSETILYNIYWLLFIPFIPIANHIYNKVNLNKPFYKGLYLSISGFLFSLFHIFLFVGIFILASHIFFSVPHRFSIILKSIISNQWYFIMIIYVGSPFILKYFAKTKHASQSISTLSYLEILTVKHGNRNVKIDVSTIHAITTDKPYSAIHTGEQKFLASKSLKKLEALFDPSVFLRVHRSAIVNKNHIIQLKSRKNGDYDAILANGQSIRFSRHYRKNWDKLITNH